MKRKLPLFIVLVFVLNLCIGGASVFAEGTTPTPTPAALPDVIVTDISWSPANPAKGDAVTFSATVKNQGTAATPEGTVIGVAFQIDGTGTSLWSDEYTKALPAGESVTLTVNGGIAGSTWTATSGSHSILAWVDDANRFQESTKTNNKFTKSLPLGTAEPTPTPTPTPTPKPLDSTILTLKIASNELLINKGGKNSTEILDAVPVIKSGRTFLPIRKIVEALGGSIAWDAAQAKVDIIQDANTISLWIDKSEAVINGTKAQIDLNDALVVPFISEGRTMLPLRFVSENLGATLVWEASTQTITITYQNQPLVESPIKDVRLSWTDNGTTGVDTATTMTITWSTAEDSDSIVKYGTAKTYGSETKGTSVKSSALGVYVHTVKLTGLTPNTVYHYTCGADASGWSNNYTFTTAPAKGTAGKFTIGVWSDTQDNAANTSYEVTSQIVAQMNKFKPMFSIHIGDMVDNGSSTKSWLNFVKAAAPLNATAPFMPVTGNHDNTSNTAVPNNFYDSFNLPDNELYYSYDYGNMHFVAINTGRPLGLADDATLFSPGTKQYEWLKADLEKASKDPNIKWKVVYLHYGPYVHVGSLAMNVRKNITPLLEQNKVDLCIAGHRHVYERNKAIFEGKTVQDGPNYKNEPFGVVYIVAGTAGGGQQGAGKTVNDAWEEVGYNFAIMEVDGNKLTYKPMHQDGTAFDEWTITK